jgi:hypothetical protein
MSLLYFVEKGGFGFLKVSAMVGSVAMGYVITMAHRYVVASRSR